MCGGRAAVYSPGLGVSVPPGIRLAGTEGEPEHISPAPPLTEKAEKEEREMIAEVRPVELPTGVSLHYVEQGDSRAFPCCPCKIT